MFIRRKTYDELRELVGRNEAQAEDIERHIDMIERMRIELRDATSQKLTDVLAELGDMTEARDDLRTINTEQSERITELTKSRNTYRAVADNCEKTHGGTGRDYTKLNHSKSVALTTPRQTSKRHTPRSEPTTAS
jgi:hypothetical protein